MQHNSQKVTGLKIEQFKYKAKRITRMPNYKHILANITSDMQPEPNKQIPLSGLPVASPISQIISLLDSCPANNLENTSFYLVSMLVKVINIQNVSELDKIKELLIVMNNAVINGLISKRQRRIMLEKISQSKFESIQVFQQTFNKYFEECVNATLDGSNYMPSLCQDLDKMFIDSILMKDQQLKESQQAIDRESEKLIKQLQIKDQESQKQRLEHASRVDIKMDCPICMEEIKLSDLALLSCQHSFHRLCTFKHLSQCIDLRNFPLRCPQCNSEALEADILEYLDNQYMQKFERLTFESFVNRHAEDMSWCPTAGCQYVFSFDGETTEFGCPVCREHYCLKCKVSFHKGMSCKEFNINRVFDKNDQQFIEFVKGAKYKQCPSCKFWVEKNEGCDHMTCRCGFEFCYVCGGVYQKCPCVLKSQQPQPNIRRTTALRPARRGRGRETTSTAPLGFNTTSIRFD